MKILIAVMSLAVSGASAVAENIPAVGVRDAIDAAVATNLTTKLAQADDDAARARVLQTASALLPSVLGTASQGRVFRENLAAQGLTFGGIDPMIGPYNSFDARAQLTQTLFDLSSIRRYRAAGAGVDLAAREEALAREQVAAAAALSYIEAVRAKKSVAAAQADADLAADLLKLADDQHTHGTATGVDVVRAKTRLSDSDVALQRAQVTERQAQIKLMRVAGWPLSQAIELKDDLTPGATAVAAIEASLPEAVSARPEIQIADEQLRVDRELLGAAQGERAPVLIASANIGLSGNQPDSGARTTGGIGVGLSLPLFSGGLITGQVREARSSLEKSEARVANFKETELRGMKPGSRAEITADAGLGRLAGHVDSIQSGTGARFSLLPPENATGNYVKVVQRIPVKIVLDDADRAGLLAPGMSVEATVEVQ